MLRTHHFVASSIAIVSLVALPVLSASAITTRVSPTLFAPSTSSVSTTPSAQSISPVVTSVAASSLPLCSGKEDQQALWSSKEKKWVCRTIPKCTGADQALRYDGSMWKCETIGGLLVGYASSTYWPGNLVGKSFCDAGKSWGAGECKDNAQIKIASLTCKPTTLKVEISSPSTDMGGNPIIENRVFCYSRAIVVK